VYKSAYSLFSAGHKYLAFDSAKHPAPFLEARVHRLDLTPGLTGVCAGYEQQEWRCKQLAEHLLEWLPEFALRHSEIEGLGADNAVRLTRRAAHTVYTTNRAEGRGELGELLLHVVLRQVFETLPAISKYYYKDSANDTIKGFDAVHVVANDGLELWLGEAKFYDKIDRAIRDAVKEIRDHTTRDYLRSEFAAIMNKIDKSWPHADKLAKLLDENTSLDEVFDRLCIPVLLTYDSETIAAHDEVSETFLQAFSEEVLSHRETFASKGLPDSLRVHLFLLPLGSKVQLIKAFDERLKSWQ
jgi:hypothetical protein